MLHAGGPTSSRLMWTQLPQMHHPSQAHGYDLVIDGRITIELPRKLVTYHVNPLSVSSSPPLLGALFNEVYQGFIIYVGCGFQLARKDPSINQSIQELSISWKALCFLGMKIYWTLEKWKPKTVFFGQEFDVFWHETEAFL